LAPELVERNGAGKTRAAREKASGETVFLQDVRGEQEESRYPEGNEAKRAIGRH
jgi:hypothetical protein